MSWGLGRQEGYCINWHWSKLHKLSQWCQYFHIVWMTECKVNLNISVHLAIFLLQASADDEHPWILTFLTYFVSADSWACPGCLIINVQEPPYYFIKYWVRSVNNLGFNVLGEFSGFGNLLSLLTTWLL